MSMLALLFTDKIEYGSLKPENFGGAKDMDTAIFQVRSTKLAI